MCISELQFDKPKIIYNRRPYMRSWYWMMRLVLVPLQRTMAASIPVDKGALAGRADDASLTDSIPGIMFTDIPIVIARPTPTIEGGSVETDIKRAIAVDTEATATHDYGTIMSPSPTIETLYSYDTVNEGAPPWIGGVAVAGVFGVCILALAVYFCCYKIFKCCGHRSKLHKKEKWNTPFSSTTNFDSTTNFATNSDKTIWGKHKSHYIPNSRFRAPVKINYPYGNHANARRRDSEDDGSWLEDWRKKIEHDLRVKAAAAEVVGIYPVVPAASKSVFTPQVAANALEAMPDLEPGVGRGSGSRSMCYF